MKKALVIVAMALLVSGAALADNNNWLLNLVAYPTALTNYAAQTIYTVNTAASVKDEYDTRDAKQINYWAASYCGTVMYRGDPGGWAGRPSDWFTKDTRIPFSADVTKTWNRIYMGIGSSFFDAVARPDLKLGWFADAASALDLAHDYILTVVSDPTGQHSGATFKWSAASGGSAVAPITIWTWDLVLANSQGKLGDITADSQTTLKTNHIELKLDVQPPPVIPEPSSLLALASGLIGLAGLALRRRA